MRDSSLQGIEAVVERQQGMLPEGDDDRLLLDRQHCRLWVFRPGREVGHRGSLLPLRDGLLVDAVAP